MIVVDTNILIHLHMNGEYTEIVQKVLKKDPYWYSPFLWRSEFSNVLLGYVRKKVINQDLAKEIMNTALETMRSREIAVSPSRILEIACSCTCSSYDCEFVALADELGVHLITLDKQILEQFPGRAKHPKDFINE